MAKSSEPWEHKLGGLANKGETQFHADDDNDNSDDNDDDNNDGDFAKDDDDDDEKVGGKRKCCWINSGVGQENRLRGGAGCKIFFTDLEQTFTRKKHVVE